MTDEAKEYGTRLRDLEAEAFRTARILAEHRRHLATTIQRPHTAPASIEQRLDAIEHLLKALARAQGITPTDTT
jgi:DNA mismatch repair ATPase MutS